MEYNWVKFYEEFADKLLTYKDNRLGLIEKIHNVFKITGIHHPTLEYGELKDIDPFTIFGLFNKGITKQNRIKIITEFKNQLSIASDVPDNFDGIPLLNNMMATYYAFQDSDKRKSNDIQNLWDLFEVALKLSSSNDEVNRKEFIRLYDLVHEQFAIKWNITMGLFWIRPKFFINLDSRNRWFMEEPDRMPVDFVNKYKDSFNNAPFGKRYLEIRDSAYEILENGNYEYKNLVDLSSKAFSYSEEINILRAKEASEEMGIFDDNRTNYWMYSAGDQSSKWNEFYEKSIMAIDFHELGDLGHYSSKKKITDKMVEVYGKESKHSNDALACWQFANVIKPDDIIFVKKGQDKIIGRGKVIGNYEYLEDEADNYRNIIKVEWIDNSIHDVPEFSNNVSKVLTAITKYTEYVVKLNALFKEEINEDVTDNTYTKEDFLNEVYMSEERYDDLVNALNYKQNIILQGAPGVGKTFIAKRLAYSLMGCKDPSRVQMVQFHQNYSYEDFIMGYKPSNNSFEIKHGVFYDFCELASKSTDDYYFIIDEINRGNLSKIFGEVFMLIEKDKRNTGVKLAYENEKLIIPSNVYIIGMMNTADRSLAMVDYALRRRFDFITIEPGFDSEGFRKYQKELNNDKFNRLVSVIKELNNDISDDESLGEGYAIGHSFLCNLTNEKINNRRLEQIIKYEIIPLIKEYWFDNLLKVKDWSERLWSSIK